MIKEIVIDAKTSEIKEIILEGKELEDYAKIKADEEKRIAELREKNIHQTQVRNSILEKLGLTEEEIATLFG